MTPADLGDEVKNHYKYQLLQEVYVLILGLDVLGNPYGLIKDFAHGVSDFFYEPYLVSCAPVRMSVSRQLPAALTLAMSSGLCCVFVLVIIFVLTNCQLIFIREMCTFLLFQYLCYLNGSYPTYTTEG